jgi:hypothetical protein
MDSANKNSTAISAKDDTEKLHRLKVQVEYYLSDENLQRDSFFHEKISNDANGYLDVDLIMNCNKVKKLDVSKEDVINAIKLSTELELADKENKVRRKGNKALPELKLLNKKRKKDEDGEGEGEEKERKDSSGKGDKGYDPIILEIYSDKEVDKKWKLIQDEFKSLNPHLDVPYSRFNKTEGHLGVLKYPNQELKFTEEFELDGVKYTVKKCQGDELINFWKNHGSHYELCVNKNRKGGKNKRNNKRDDTRLKNPVKLGDEV